MARGNDGMGWIVGGAAALVVLPLMTIVLEVNIVVSILVAAAMFGGIVLLMSPRGVFEGVDLKGLSKGRIELARELLLNATVAADRLRVAGRLEGETLKSADQGMAIRKIRQMSGIADEALKALDANPASAVAMQRFLTFYLPRAAEIAEGYITLASQRRPDAARLASVEDVIVKLEDAFTHYSDSIVSDELSGLDADIRLVQASLKEDIR